MSGGVRKIAQIAVGAVIGFAQGGPIGAAIGAGLAFYASEQQEKLNTKSPLRDNEPSAQTVRSSKAPARFILGRVSTGGVLVWAQEEAGAQRDGEWLHLVYVLCEGAVDALEDIYLGEELITTYGADASYELVVNPTQVNAFLKANCPDWKDEQIGRGLSFVRLSLRYNAEKFPSGIPDARFVVRGRNDLYDPRTGMAGYSENTALHILWFLRARCGVPDDEIVFETFASGANVCDESVANPDGTTSPRYRSSCVIGADEQRTNVLQKLEAACGGKVIRVGGRWMFQAGAYYGPWDFEITEDMVIGTITGSTEPTNDAAINTIRGTFTDTTQSWTETDYPEVSVAEWVVADGGEAAETLTFSYVTNPYQAQRLANIELRRRRAGGVINVPLNLLGYNCRPGRAVRANLPSLNILGEFIVTGWSMGTSEGCTASLQVYDPAIFDDAVGKPYNPIGFISMPSGGLGSPTGLAWNVDDSAEVTQGVLSWDAPVGIVTGYAVTVRQAGVAVQAHQVPETTLQLPLSGLPSGNYTMSVAAAGPLARSGEASITVNIDGPPVPEACVVTATIESINLAPSNVQHGLNGGTYEYFYTMDSQAPVSQAEYLGQGLSLTHTGLAFFTNYYYFIRAKNAYGVSGYLKIAASTSTDVSTMLEALKGKIERGQIGPVLGEEIDGLQDQINALDGLKAYDKNEPYEEGQMVVVDGRIYQAVHDVPADPSGANAPPNVAFWIDVGQSIETANGLAQQVQTNTAKIEEVDGKVTSTAESVQVLRASSRDDDAEGELAGALKLWTSTAAIARESQVRTTETEALARSTETLTAQVGEAKSSIQRTDEVVAGIDGKVSAISSWKTETNVNGKKVATGIVQGSDGSVGQIIMSADQVVIANGLSGPEANLFVFQNGQMYVNTAFINSAFIQQLILGMTLRSQAVDSQGRPLIELNMVTGTFTLRGQDGNGSTLINNGGIYVYDLNNIERAALGRMT
ncbi:DUF1983 domain-containing protein [Pseudomonas mosselii]|uniref:phage tail tip fiber protein n=1 Tax=Pseudomonas mosselii TaxID=78327 RepID=UPI0024487BD4|nr:DUF1983 domain-containing protein [Pseudomonas mosselii]MDH1143323.1 DUF1983 domain-containing protein [Pseudomonas mosselii]